MKIKNSFLRTAVSTALALAFLMATLPASLHAATMTNYDSIVALATNATKTYTFTDPNSVQSVVVAVTMTAYSPTITPTSLQSLDGDTRVGGNNQNGFINGSGVNFSASLVSSSSGVAASSIKFAITALGIRPSDGSGTVNWTSAAGTSSVFLGNGNEVMQALDTTNAALGYAGQLRFPDGAQMQLTDLAAPGQSIVFTVTFTSTATNDAQTSAWLTAYSGQYARITTNTTTRNAGTSVTTWTNNNSAETQSLPAYCGVQEIYSSTNWIYFRSTGLGSHTMGPWYNDATRTTLFINWPCNQKVLYRIPRSTTLTAPPAVKTTTAGADAAVGYFVDGVAVFDPTDGFSYSGGSEASPGTGQWHRDAYINEAITFDVGNSHQQNTGTYHNHADPIALRYLLGDNILKTPTNTYVENVTNLNLKHSPVLGWARDGYPIYGPYAYSTATNANSSVRRMVSGFVLRDGNNGTDNLTNTARATLPAWMLRNNGNTAASGPAISSTYPLGRYNQDNAYLGDLVNPNTGQTNKLGVDFDLNEYNVRFCVTPEFPKGTYAYFICITSNGTPTFPYNMPYYFYGNPTGGTVTNIAETVTTNFLGGTNMVSKMSSASYLNGGFVSLKWTGIDGGTYQIEGSTNLTSWTSLAGGLTINTYTTNGPASSYLDNVGALDKRFYRAGRTAIAAFDPVTGTTGSGTAASGISSIAPNSGKRGTNAVANPVVTQIT
ncbi:MAG: hypothetical protein RL616_1709, partial [Verrucomicrobiota bacterium]